MGESHTIPGAEQDMNKTLSETYNARRIHNVRQEPCLQLLKGAKIF